MSPPCPACDAKLELLTGGTVTRLFRCGKCGAQLMVPVTGGVAEQPAGAIVLTAPSPAAEGASAAASTTPSPEAPPPPAKKSWLSKIFGG